LIYAGAQKNAGIAGLTVVIVHQDLLDRARPDIPSVMSYKAQVAADSMLNTAPTFAWYMCALVLEWIEDQGGVAEMATRNERKAAKLYEYIDGSNFYASPVADDCRSWMNVPFTLADPQLDQAFLDGAQTAGLAGLKGHRSVGGMRASLYNALPEAAVDALVEYMREFERIRS
ncbi:MAG: 3-phosphoserine/phosphohydroxythreonine transaminase, partial [Gammaproteobacteria bacterium]|nr:3-phosphoserine/phosphohydroxythreonine transaminase [Gammaproteobacteria bacterium]